MPNFEKGGLHQHIHSEMFDGEVADDAVPAEAGGVEEQERGVVGKVIDAIEDAPPRAVIVVAGLTEGLLHTESLRRFATEKGIALVAKSDGGLSSVKKELAGDEDVQVILDMPYLLRDILAESGDEDLSHLLHRSDEPAAELTRWIDEKMEGYDQEEGGPAPIDRFTHAVQAIRDFALSSDRPFRLAMPANSALALALFTFILEGHQLTPEAIEDTWERTHRTAHAIAQTREKFTVMTDPIAILEIVPGQTATVTIGEEEKIPVRL